MRDFRLQVGILGRLHALPDEAVAGAFRRGMAGLAQVASDPACLPLEGLDPEQLRQSLALALSRRCFDDLAFLARPRAAAALYALASALSPLAPERRELGRRVLLELSQGELSTFVGLATAFALGSARALEGPRMRARLELALALPAANSPGVDALAFALLSQRELALRYVVEPARMELTARRSAACLVERAARHATIRAQHGDDGELALFETLHVKEALAQLLADREPLVFRHAACARGLLSVYTPQRAEELERDLMTSRSLSRTRRGAISLAARLALRPVETLARARQLLQGPAFARDGGLAAALIYGLVRPMQVEPEAAESLLVLALELGGSWALEALVELRREVALSARSRPVIERALAHARERPHAPEDEVTSSALIDLLAGALEGEPAREPVRFPERVAHALRTYAEQGPKAASLLASDALTHAQRLVSRIVELSGESAHDAQGELLSALYELDHGLLERAGLPQLLASAAPSGEAGPTHGALCTTLTELLERLSLAEESPTDSGADALPLRMRRLRALLHILDADFRAPDEQLGLLRDTQRRAVRRLCLRISRQQPSPTDRIVHAALARGVDALLRAELLELSDVVLCLAHDVPLPEGLQTIAEGSLVPELKSALQALSSLVQACAQPGPQLARTAVEALDELAHALSSDTSPRTEALRRALLSLARALGALLAARSLRELTRVRRVLSMFEGALIELGQLLAGARRRLGFEVSARPLDTSALAAVARAIESGVTSAELLELGPTLDWLERELAQGLAAPFAKLVSAVFGHVRAWPLEAPEGQVGELAVRESTEAYPLPTWVSPSRRIGPYLLVRPLGVGIASSVFVVKRHDAPRDAPLGLVLKTPRYDAHVARELSEDAFEAAFARELPALLTVPPHPNLAPVLAVESQREPKPYLVMKWIEGPTLDRVRKRKLHAPSILDGLLGGLEALHSVGVGHLDLTPSHVVLRASSGRTEPVLVDFGLAGRSLRPGCGDAAYRAPELWGNEPTTPAAVDVYALGCLAFELVTGRALFAGAEEDDLARAHLEHDGSPAGVVELTRDPTYARFGEWLRACLRRSPERRASADELRRRMRG